MISVLDICMAFSVPMIVGSSRARVLSTAGHYGRSGAAERIFLMHSDFLMQARR